MEENRRKLRKQRSDILRGPTKSKKKPWSEFSNREKIIYNTSKRLRRYIFGYIETDKSRKIFGISVDGYREYLKCKFKEGMSWDNYGEIWCIDHIKPYRLFDVETDTGLFKCFNYKNTQPLFIGENCFKLDKDISESNLSSLLGDVRGKFKNQNFTKHQIIFLAKYLPLLYTIEEIKQELLRSKKNSQSIKKANLEVEDVL